MRNGFSFEAEPFELDTLFTEPEAFDTERGIGNFEVALPRIEDRTGLADKSHRKGRRDPQKLNALVLHQMACCHRRKEGGYDTIGSHFAILADGRILQMHPIEALVYASNGFNARSVAVEFAGNFPSIRGKCWKAKEHGCQQLSQAQVDAGRYLIEHLRKIINLKYIFAHRQSSATRENDPGPDIWYHVGQWALDKYGLSDGGPGFRITYSAKAKASIKGLGDGQPIPDEWRTWGHRLGATSPAPGPTSTPAPSRAPGQLQAAGGGSTLDFLKTLLGIPQAVVAALQLGQEHLAIRLAIARGQRNVDLLTNMVFFARHPERKGRSVSRADPGFASLSKEWLEIRERLVRPVVVGTAMPVRNAPSAAGTNRSTITVPGGSSDPVVKDVAPKKLKSGEPGVMVVKTAPFVPDLQEPRDIALGVTAAAEGGYDTVNMYDRGIISWGIMQWTAHAGSLQNALGYIKNGLKRRLGEVGQATFWSQLFPGLDLQLRGRDYAFVYRGAVVQGLPALRRLFRGREERGQFDRTTIDGWARSFARAGRQPLVQELQREYARQEVNRALQRDLGDFFRSRHYGRVADYVGRENKATALFFGMWTQNPTGAYKHLKLAIDNLAQSYGSHDLNRWPQGWPARLSNEFESVLRASRFGYWGDAKAGAAGRVSRTQKILAEFHRLMGGTR